MKRLRLLVVGLALLTACGGSGDASEETTATVAPPPDPIPNIGPLPPATTLKCAQGTHLTYENFGEAFLRNYCVACHSSDLAAGKRGGAPAGANFDSAAAVALWRAGMLAKAGTDTSPEPPVNNISSLERTQFASWLNCGAPER